MSHADLDEEVVAHAVAYVTDLPVLHIHKSAAPSPVQQGEELKYTIRMTNQGQQATGLLISDTIPANTTYVPGSASGSGQLVGDEVQWERSVLDTGEAREFTFRVVVDGAAHIVNERYAVVCAEGVTAVGAPVATQVGDGSGFIYLPLVLRNH